MMKNFKQFIAFVLTLCMLFSLSVAAFAAEADEHTIYDSAPDEEPVVSSEAATSGTIQNSGIRWSLDEKGWLTISAAAKRRCSKAQTISLGRLSAIRSPRSGLRTWKRCLSQIWRTGSRAAST